MLQPKAWLNYPSTTTPRNAAALIGLELRTANWAGDVGFVGPGAGGYEDFRVKQRAAAANMSVDVGLGGSVNVVLVPTDGIGGAQRYEYAGGQLNVPITTADATNPRIDRIVAEAPTNVDSVAPRVFAIAGTPTGGATLDNLTGAAAVGATRTLLADIVVGAAVGTIVTANIRDRRPVALQAVPWLLTGRDQVSFENLANLQTTHGGITVTTHDNMQAWVLQYLPRRIVNATRMRWRYRQGATAAATAYNLGIWDASGRLIISTGSVNFLGALNTYQERGETITATTFDAGWYYVGIGIAPMTASSAVNFPGISGALASGQVGPQGRNMALRSATGSTTLPTTLLAATDTASLGVDTAIPAVPLIVLSVG